MITFAFINRTPFGDDSSEARVLLRGNFYGIRPSPIYYNIDFYIVNPQSPIFSKFFKFFLDNFQQKFICLSHTGRVSRLTKREKFGKIELEKK